MIKIRVGSSDLMTFESQDDAFGWVSKNYYRCIVSVLRYDNDQLDSMERYMYSNGRFSKENIRE